MAWILTWHVIGSNALSMSEQMNNWDCSDGSGDFSVISELWKWHSVIFYRNTILTALSKSLQQDTSGVSAVSFKSQR